MMKNARRKFTKWYFKKGYTFGYTDFSPPRAVCNCPWYIKPFLFLFSPSVYQMEWSNEYIVKGFMEGLAKGLELKNTEEKP